MIRLSLQDGSAEEFRVLCLGSHSDDIEIGCGGTVLRLLRTYRNLSFRWVVFSGGPTRSAEARRSAEAFLRGSNRSAIEVRDFTDGFFPSQLAEIKRSFEELRKQFQPDLVFTHSRNDLHQDHRVICELTWNTFRDHLILEYEIVKYDGDLGAPNAFFPLEEEVAEEKVRNLLLHFPSQSDNHWFRRETFLSLLRIRGVESNSPSGLAESFYCRKAVL